MSWEKFVLYSACLVTAIIVIGDKTDASVAFYIKQICSRIPIHTTVSKTSGDNGFRIIIHGLPTENTYRPGETYTVEVTGSDPTQRLMGLMVSASAYDEKGQIFVPGSFNTSVDGRVQNLLEDGTCESSVVSHRYLVNKPGAKFLWTAPVPGVGCVHFNGTVIEHSDVWYKDEGRLHTVICDDSTQQDSANALSGHEEECCACGHAMYTVEFQGLWSRQTHPKGFPDEKNAFQLHWSNVVGASHSPAYQIWDYGQYASKAVKEVCEYGSSRSLENDMRDNGEKIRTVIKTKQLWGPVRILDSLSAGFTVNKHQHLLSLITMIGPSPDWCLGVTGQSMCLANCTWRDNLEIDLYPWDAGADSRVTYIGRKMPTRPPERIRRITSTFPSDRESPFYRVDIKPLARLTIRKNKEACTDDNGRSNSGENTPTTDELVSSMKKKLMMKKKMNEEKCATSLWSEWSDCSNPCGTGVQERRRMLKNQAITAAMCDLRLLESKSCVGDCTETNRNKLHNNFVMRHDEERDPQDVCAVTNWSDWSPCSATCGLGMKERWRMFLYNSEKRVDCGVHLMEKDLCRGDTFDCHKAMMMKNFTAICQLPADAGPCRGDFPRFFYNHTMEKCQVFSYGGCRGNENRFDTQKECVDLCAEHMASVHRGELGVSKPDLFGPREQQDMMLDKTLMMQKQRMMEEERMRAKQKMMEEDMRRKELMMQKQSMMEEDRRRKEMMMKKQAMMEEDMRQKELMMEKQRMMEEDRRMKELMMQKQRMMERENREREEEEQSDLTDEERKALMIKQQMMRKQADDNTETETELDRAKARLMRKQRKMMKRKQRKEKRRKKRRKSLRSRKTKGGQPSNDGPPVDCMVTPWSDWSECSITCGRGFIMRTRMVKVPPQNGGRRCPRRMVRKRKCRKRKCPTHCVMGEWSEWSPCSETCGDRAVQTRRRSVIKRPRQGGMACGARREKKFCNLPMCPNSRVEESMRRFMMFHRRY